MNFELPPGLQEFQVGEVVLVRGTIIRVELKKVSYMKNDIKRVYSVQLSEEYLGDDTVRDLVFIPFAESIHKLPRSLKKALSEQKDEP